MDRVGDDRRHATDAKAGGTKRPKGKTMRNTARTPDDEGTLTLFERMPLWSRPGYLIRRMHQIHHALFFEECKDFNITPVQYGVMTALKYSPDLDQHSLGLELGIDRTNAADVLVRLEKRGLVSRRRSTEDKRMVLARLTPEGAQVTDDMLAAMQRAQDRLMEPLLPQERNAFITMLIRLIDGNNHLGRATFNPKL